MQVNRSMPPGTFIPELVYDNLDDAVVWLCKTFGFEERLRISNHRSQLVFGDGSLVAIARTGEGPSRTTSVAALGRTGDVTHSVMVRVSNVDEHFERAKRRGARILSSPETYPFGERQYTAEDIGGHRWTFTESMADVAPKEWGGLPGKGFSRG